MPIDHTSSPLTNTDKLLLELFNKGALNRLVVGPMSHKAAVSLRHRLYRFRQKMIKTQHQLANAADSVMIEVVPIPVPDLPPESAYQLILSPVRAALEAALSNAGIDIGMPPPLDLLLKDEDSE